MPQMNTSSANQVWLALSYVALLDYWGLLSTVERALIKRSKQIPLATSPCHRAKPTSQHLGSVFGISIQEFKHDGWLLVLGHKYGDPVT
jgi:hypothetical protein